MTERHRISVVVPVRNGERFVADAVDSVLAQTRRADEIVVVDDGSTDDTLAVLERYGDEISVVAQTPSGFAAAVNRGVDATVGPFLAFLDADDLWSVHKLERQERVLVDDDDLDAVFGHAVQFVDRAAIGDDRHFKIDGAPQPSHLFGAMLVRRGAFERVGRLDEAIASMANVDWYARALDAGLRSEMLSDVVMRRRIHGENLSLKTGTGQKQHDATRLLRAHLARRRSGQ